MALVSAASPAGAGNGGAPADPAGIAHRDPRELMDPVRLAAMQPNRLSAARSLAAVLLREGWSITLDGMDLDRNGAGTVRYRIDTGRGILSFVAFSSEPRMVDRTPRIIGQSWDMVGALLEGEADDERVARTRAEMPKLYAGRAAPGTLVWCRSNRSLRAFDHAVAELAAGRQPDAEVLTGIGYLMRNTGLDGNGTFGTKTFLSYGPDHPLRLPYHAQLLTAYLMREFGFDLCEHMAACAAEGTGTAARLAPSWRRYLGLGNGSALGLVLFTANHPRLVHQWLWLREEALLAARRLAPPPGDPAYGRLIGLLERMATYRAQDRVHYGVFTPSATVAAELRGIVPLVERLRRDGGTRGAPAEHPFEELRREVAATASADTAETLDALLTELVPEVCDALLPQLIVDEHLVGDPAMTVAGLRELLGTAFAWALELPIADEAQRRRIWYKSRSSEEPRSGPREETSGGFDLSVDLPGEVRRLDAVLRGCDPAARVGEVLFEHPELRATAERVQALSAAPYAHPHVDVLDDDFVPARCIRLVNGALYGLDRTKDYLNRTLRGLIFQGTPSRAELGRTGADDTWWAPAEPERRP
ncbi:hypothetical protein CLV63_10794 [Murinocardiopsis flavida]|uniref:Uncharacterized protein n=1 Tax=Murinocardiopsis flavida TaxID=645275 RepID=A0A2P8DKL1_9ACTN|nr:hypothetical protein [Murinocardiopsis flavida]PSK97701.1 hypothetical protein CLV63_10794 [Murinocardiopsis flavida]